MVVNASSGPSGLYDSRKRRFMRFMRSCMEKEGKEENFRRVERQYGSFTRSFTLPSSVDPGRVSADYYQGVLKIRLAKKADAKPKQIKVNVGGERTPGAKAVGKAA